MPKDNEQTSLSQSMDDINEAVQEAQKDATEDMKNIQKEEKSEKKSDSRRKAIMDVFIKEYAGADRKKWGSKLENLANNIMTLNKSINYIKRRNKKIAKIV